MHTGDPSSLRVLWTVVPKQAHHQLSCGTEVGLGAAHASAPGSPVTLVFRAEGARVPTCLGLLPQGGDLGHVRQGLLPRSRLEQNRVPHLNELAVPLDALEARPQHRSLLSLWTQAHAENLQQHGDDEDEPSSWMARRWTSAGSD